MLHETSTMDQLTFERENRDRIQAVEQSFGPKGKPLYQPGRILLGEGRLIKQGRRKPQPKDFYLFNDMLVYGSMILNGRWHKNQKIIRLEDVMLEDMEDGIGLQNQWLIRTPRKSFFVAASSPEEKRAWMDHIADCRTGCLQSGSCRPCSQYAASWIPDQAAYKCMRCLDKFTVTRRRYHCRKCGFLVCNTCSKQREVISHIHPTKQLRVCRLCYTMKDDEASRQRGDSTGLGHNDVAPPTDEEEEKEDEATMESHAPSTWLDFQTDTCGQMNTDAYLIPMHLRPHLSYSTAATVPPNGEPLGRRRSISSDRPDLTAEDSGRT